jgi:hypothetical protein
MTTWMLVPPCRCRCPRQGSCLGEACGTQEAGRACGARKAGASAVNPSRSFALPLPLVAAPSVLADATSGSWSPDTATFRGGRVYVDCILCLFDDYIALYDIECALGRRVQPVTCHVLRGCMPLLHFLPSRTHPSSSFASWGRPLASTLVFWVPGFGAVLGLFPAPSPQCFQSSPAMYVGEVLWAADALRGIHSKRRHSIVREHILQ